MNRSKSDERNGIYVTPCGNAKACLFVRLSNRQSPFTSPLCDNAPDTFMKKLLFTLLAIVLLPVICLGWGRDGHQIVATIAEDHLNETAKVMIQSLIGNNHLYSIASWADDIRRERRETGPWHYVNIPLGSQYDASRDCAPPRSCIVAKINDLVKVLIDKNAPREDRTEALRFLVHFVGDVHQPMHAAREAKGGNGVKVSYLSSARCGPYDCNLHGVWDSSMILHARLSRAEYAEHEEKLIKMENLESQASGTPEQWANESVKRAQAAWVQNGANLEELYDQQEIKVVDRQMALAGLRLAKLLNDTIGKMTPRDFASSTRDSATAEVAPTTPESAMNEGRGAADSIKVWVNTSSSVYHCPNTRWYGNTKRGEYMTQAQAHKQGYRPVGGHSCE
jgi:hypothetical protein